MGRTICVQSEDIEVMGELLTTIMCDWADGAIGAGLRTYSLLLRLTPAKLQLEAIGAN